MIEFTDPLKDLNAKKDHGILSLEQSRIQSPQTRREQLNAQLLAYFVSLNEKAQKGTFEKRLRAKKWKGSVDYGP